MIHDACGFFTSSPNHYAVCGWRIAPGFWAKVRRRQRVEARQMRDTMALLNRAEPEPAPEPPVEPIEPHRRKIKPRDIWIYGQIYKWYVRGALARYVDGDQAATVEAMTARIIASRHKFGYDEHEAMGFALAYADGLIHSPYPTPPPPPLPYGKARR